MRVGDVAIQFISATPEDVLSAICRVGIQMREIHYRDEMHVDLIIPASRLSEFQNIVKRFGGETCVLDHKGYATYFKYIISRPVLIVGICLWALLTLFLPSRVLFVEVVGNEKIPTHIILDAAEKCGLHIGSSRRMIRSERIKNLLLDEFSGLQWVGVNTYGCVAVISVKERVDLPTQDVKRGVLSIVAARDGVISNITSTKGTVMCTVGQAVRKGQVLISGYTDCGLLIKAEQASGEVFAQTNRIVRGKFPVQYHKLKNKKEVRTVYQIQIGKKIINLCKDSGISDARCVKMYYKKQMVLPGGLSLPIALVRQESVYYEDCTVKLDVNKQSIAVKSLMDSDICSAMLAGEILKSEFSIGEISDFSDVYGIYHCVEMIGEIHQEEFLR